jgi:hypothetical protein
MAQTATNGLPFSDQASGPGASWVDGLFFKEKQPTKSPGLGHFPADPGTIDAGA